MIAASFTKLFASITDSSIWSEDSETKIVWITMLAMSDQFGRVNAAIPGLAKRANVTIEATEKALAKFLSPDIYSRTKDHEGRRIEVIEGGWRLLNHEIYRDLRSEEDRKEQNRQAQQRQRDKKRQQNVINSQQKSAESAHTDTDTDTDKRREESPSLPREAEMALNGNKKHHRTILPIEWEFQKLWKKEWEIFHSGQKCMWTLKDDGAVPILLEIESDFQKVMDIAKKAWGLDGGKFEAKVSIKFSTFVSEFNSIRKAVGSLQSKKPYKPETTAHIREIEKKEYLERVKKEKQERGEAV